MNPTIPVFDGHNDFSEHMEDNDGKMLHERLLEEHTDGHLDLPRMRRGNFAGGFFAVYVAPPSSQQVMTDEEKRRYNFTPISHEFALPITLRRLRAFKFFEEQHGDLVRIVHSATQISEAMRQGLTAIMLHIEGAEAICTDLSNLNELYDIGVRSIGPVWSRENAFGFGVPSGKKGNPDSGPGLKAPGKDLIRACNEIGILVDLSHMNEQGFWDTAQISSKPLVATHSCVHAISPSMRNLTDRQIDAIGESNGLIGINFAVHFLRPDCVVNEDTPISLIVDHATYIAERIGIDHVALGSDFDGAPIPHAIKDVTGLPLLLQAFADGGFSLEDIEKLAYKNWLRVIRETLAS